MSGDDNIIDDEGGITSKDFASILGCTIRRVQLLGEEDILKRLPSGKRGRWSFVDSLVSLCKHQEERLNTGAQRVNLRREQKLVTDRELVELKIAERRAEVIQRKHLDTLLSQFASEVAKVHDRALADIEQITKDERSLSIFSTAVYNIRKRCSSLRVMSEEEYIAMVDQEGDQDGDDGEQPPPPPPPPQKKRSKKKRSKKKR